MTTPMVHAMLAQVAAFAKAKRLSLYLVGGFVRDQLLGRARHPVNLDFAIASGALTVGQELAARLRGTYICLDEATRTSRVVVGSGEGRLELDLADFRGRALEDDLAKRDFTINAMAVALDDWLADPKRWAARLIDPLQGRRDLADRRLRACFPETFLDDPVRILRAFRFAVELSVTLEPSLTALMASASFGLSRIAGERVRDELFAILHTDRASWALARLNEVGALDVLFPELVPGRGIEQGGYHHLDVLNHQLEAVAQCDRMLLDLAEFSQALRAPLAAYLAQDVVERRTRQALVKLGALYHDVGKPATRRIKDDGEIWFIGHEQFGAELTDAMAIRLRLSNREAEMVRHLVLFHLRPGHLSRQAQLTRRAIFRFFRDVGEDGPACLLMWWADRLATRGPASHLDQIDQQRARLEELLGAYFFKPEEAVRPPRLLDGRQLMEALGLTPGPVVGELLRAIEEAQAEGRLQTKEDALALARELLKTQ
ncbi:MAG: HD domain-containing protein [Candidatus Omnitrophica bacterium]|nr:HD domain-containing protein [Candidatus Omnitrophota bacterium]